MDCVACGSAAVTARPEHTAQGYRRFRCRKCDKQFNGCSGGLLNYTQYPSDVIALVVLWLWRLRHRLTLRDLAEMFLVRGIVVSHEAVRDWEAKLAPVLADALRQRRQGIKVANGARSRSSARGRTDVRRPCHAPLEHTTAVQRKRGSRTVTSPNSVQPSLRGDTLLLGASQALLSRGQGRVQAGQVGQIIGPRDSHDVGAVFCAPGHAAHKLHDRGHAVSASPIIESGSIPW